MSRNVFSSIGLLQVLILHKRTAVAIEDAEEVVIISWEVVDMNTGVLHVVSPPYLTK
jgi:hypothetical protein